MSARFADEHRATIAAAASETRTGILHYVVEQHGDHLPYQVVTAATRYADDVHAHRAHVVMSARDKKCRVVIRDHHVPRPRLAYRIDTVWKPRAA